jgi:hypothetical protein
MCNLDAVSVCQVLQIIGQLVHTGHLAAVNQHGNHGYILTRQSRRNLMPDWIFRFVQTPLAGTARDRHPGWADNGQQCAAVLQMTIDNFTVIDAFLDTLDVHKNRRGAEGLHQVIEQQPCFAFGIVPAITEKILRLTGPPSKLPNPGCPFPMHSSGN